jgi:ribosomal protein S18 acetylase RimI-like enzyme
MIIRPTVEDDWAALKAVRLAALRDAPAAFGVTYAAAAQYTDDQWRARAAGALGPEFWLAWDGEAPAGLIGGALDGAGRYTLISMWVAPGKRRSGVATQLVRTVQARAIARGHARVVLGVVRDNAPAVALYLRLGFVFIDEWEALESHPHIRVQTMEWRAQGA